MSDLRETLERIVAPPPSPSFHDDLNDRVQASQRVSARRWRAVALVATVAAIAAASAAGVLAVGRASGGTTTVDRTIACPVVTQLDSADLGFAAAVKGTPVAGPNGGMVTPPGYISADAEQMLYAAASTLKAIVVSAGHTVKSGYFFNNSVCKSARAIPLTRSGLPLLGVFSRAGYNQLTESCLVAANSTATVRLRVVLSGSGSPVAARLAVRGGKHQRPLAFVDWTPTRFTAFAAAACMQR